MPRTETPPRLSWRPTLIGKRYAVACGHYLAAAAAVRILERGGNAVDAGVSAAMALAILQPDVVSFSGVAPTLVYQKSGRAVHSRNRHGANQLRPYTRWHVHQTERCREPCAGGDQYHRFRRAGSR